MDEAILRAVNAWSASPAIAAFGVFLSSAWMVVLTVTPVAIVLLVKKKYIAIASIALSMGASDAINARIIKPIVGRERPCRALTGLEQPAKCGSGRSFASGHAAVSLAFVVSASPVVRFGWWILTPLGLLVASSRVLLGVHYPSDVFAGAILGALIGGLFWFLRVRMEKMLAANKPSPAPTST